MNAILHAGIAERTAAPQQLSDSYAAAIAPGKDANEIPYRIQNILVAINSLESARGALKNARLLAERTGAKITILYAARGGSASASRQLQDDIARISGINPGQLRAILIRPDATGHLQIKNAALDEAANLIIIPADFHSGRKHFWQADPMEKLMRQAPCPLLVVGNQENRSAENA